MNLRIRRRRSSPRTCSLLSWGGRLFLFIGILTLGWVGFTLLESQLYQASEHRRFENQLRAAEPMTSGGEPDSRPLLSPDLANANPLGSESRGIDAAGSPLGRIEIGTIGLTAMILEGSDTATLRRAVGHIPGTSLPGQEGNVALAGHRDTFFRPLRKIRENDEITLTTLYGSYRYRVESTRIVEPEDTAVLNDSHEAILTLVTCYPFNFLGSAPQRFIVRAHRIP
jgi:sortase A